MALLTDTRLRALKPRATVYRVSDMGGLSIEVRPSGAKCWRFRYRFAGKANMLALGEYPAMSLQDARRERDRQRALLKAGQDPSAVRQDERLRASLASADSFEAVAREWMAQRGEWTAATHQRATWILETYAFPWIGRRPVSSMTALDVLALVRRPESLGKHDTATRLKQRIGQVMRYAVGTGRADRDPTADLRGVLKTVKVRHHAGLTDRAAVGALMRAIWDYRGHAPTVLALRIAPLVFLRPGELRQGVWGEIDLDAAEWRIPADRMKMRTPHIVPLSRQAVELLRELEPHTGGSPHNFLFPSIRTRRRPMSDNTIGAALRKLGFTSDMQTAHGFRTTASTLLNEAGFNRDWIERQLAHSERDGVRAAYNYAEWLPERRRMMQAWADLLDALRDGGKVLAFTPPAAGRVR